MKGPLRYTERYTTRVRKGYGEPWETIHVEATVDFDVEGIVELLVGRAANARSQKATDMHGRIKVWVKRV